MKRIPVNVHVRDGLATITYVTHVYEATASQLTRVVRNAWRKYPRASSVVAEVQS